MLIVFVVIEFKKLLIRLDIFLPVEDGVVINSDRIDLVFLHPHSGGNVSIIYQMPCKNQLRRVLLQNYQP